MLSGFALAYLSLPRVGPPDQPVQVITIRAIGAKRFLVEETLDPATQADLVGVTLGADRPTHLAVPATTEQHHADSGHSGGQKAEGPQPLRLLIVLTHNAEPITAYDC